MQRAALPPKRSSPPSIALIGVGRWGANILRVLQDRGALRAVCARDPVRTAERLSALGSKAEVFPDVQAVLDDPAIRGVFVATPPDTHADIVVRALEAGKAVFVEKPMTMSVADAQRVLQAARETSRPIFVGHIFHYHPAWDALRAATAEDPPVRADLSWARFGPFHEELLWSFGSHEVGLLHALFASSIDTTRVLEQRSTGSRLDAVTLEMRMTRGGTARVRIDRREPIKRKTMKVETASGAILVWEDDRLYHLPAGAEAFRPVPLPAEEPLGREIDAFIEAADGGAAPLVGVAEGAAIVAALAKITTVVQTSKGEWQG